MSSRTSRLAPCVALALLVATGVWASDYTLDWWSVDGGGAMSSSTGGLELWGTIGQPDAGGPMIGGTLELTGGFWFAAPSALPGDCNGDGYADLYDYAGFTTCMLGPGGGLGSGCGCLDLDNDGDVDLHDAAIFGTAFVSGP